MVTEPRKLPALTCRDVQVWYQSTESLGEPTLAAARNQLSAEERLRCDRYRRPRDRRDYAVAHALLRATLSRYSHVDPKAWTFDVGAHGQPTLSTRAGVGAKLNFSLSHAQGVVACAIATRAHVGIDVTRTNTPFDYSTIAPRYCTPDELLQLNDCAPQQRSIRFLELWALKEAYTKATGRGLSEPLSELGFLFDGDRIHFEPPSRGNRRSWLFALFALEPCCRMAVAISGNDIGVYRLTATCSDSGFQPKATAVSPKNLATSR